MSATRSEPSGKKPRASRVASAFADNTSFARLAAAMSLAADRSSVEASRAISARLESLESSFESSEVCRFPRRTAAAATSASSAHPPPWSSAHSC